MNKSIFHLDVTSMYNSMKNIVYSDECCYGDITNFDRNGKRYNMKLWTNQNSFEKHTILLEQIKEYLDNSAIIVLHVKINKRENIKVSNYDNVIAIGIAKRSDNKTYQMNVMGKITADEFKDKYL